MKAVLITGANGFIGRNLAERLSPDPAVKVLQFEAGDRLIGLKTLLGQADFIFHAAGVNRPAKETDYYRVNYGLTRNMVDYLIGLRRPVPVVFTSSIQALLPNSYGMSKKRAEEALIGYSWETGAKVYLFRLPNVFGKYARPNYNSVVATFCYNIAHNLEVSVTEPGKILELVYIDDVVNRFVRLLWEPGTGPDVCYHPTPRSFLITLGELATRIRFIHDRQRVGEPCPSGDQLTKYLEETYLYYAGI